MISTPLGLTWIVCHDETRSVVRRSVACPSRGPTPGIVCLGCRFLVTSSLERAREGWCAAVPDVESGDDVRRRGPLDANRRAAVARAHVTHHARSLPRRHLRRRVPLAPSRPDVRSLLVVPFVSHH